MSLQQRMNENGSINISLLTDTINELSKKGWVSTTFDDVKEHQLIKYIKYKEDGNLKFISGGIVISKEDDYLIFKGGPRNWSLQKVDIFKIWSSDTLFKKKQDSKITFKLRDTGKYEVIFNDEVIYRTDNLTNSKTFLTSKKYEKIQGGAEYVVIKV